MTDFLYVGSFWTGSNAELSHAPDGLILESVKNDLPIMHVAMNYRLGCTSSNNYDNSIPGSRADADGW